MLAGQSLIVVSTINVDVTRDVLTEFFADLIEGFFVARLSHYTVGEVGVHSGTIPVGIAERLWMPIDPKSILFSGSL